MAFNKIFFNLGQPSHSTGIGDLIKRCTEAGIPVFLACTDGMTGLYDLQVAAKASGAPHTGNYRTTGYRGNVHMDVPDYNLPPEEAAAIHWQAHRAAFPPELDRDVIWVSTINEVRPYVGWGPQGEEQKWDKPIPGFTGWADWMGAFAYCTAQHALKDGYRWTAFGWAAGNPEEGSWEQPWMLKFLRLCEQHPDYLGINLHEGSMTVDTIWHMKGRMVGRFEDLLHACDKHGIGRPKIHITEFGWAYDDIPPIEVAMQHIREVSEYYARFPEIVGAGIWSLIGGEWVIGEKVQKLIAPITEFTLATRYLDPAPAPPAEEDPAPLEEAVWERSVAEQTARGLSLNPTATLQAAIFKAEGFTPVTSEFWLEHDGKQYACMAAEHLGTGERRVYVALVPQWNNVWFISDPKRAPGPAPFRFHHWPTNYRVVTQPFGVNPHLYQQWGLPGHEGVDFKAPHGSPVYAVAAGEVYEVVGHEDGHNYGIRIRVRHGVYRTIYAHLERALVKKGDTVDAGQIVGTADNTGNSFGSHLHLTLKRDGANEGYPHEIIDPTPYMSHFDYEVVGQPQPAPAPQPIPPKTYHGPAVTFMPALHGPGSDWMWQLGNLQGMLRRVNLPIKFLSHGINADYWKDFHKPAFHLIRIFWQPHTYRTPAQVWDEVRDGVMRFYSQGARNFELFNEPNLHPEGLGTVWGDGSGFGLWLADFIHAMRKEAPEAQFYYPGLSPSGPSGGPWTNQFDFTNKAWPHVKHLCHGMCMHAYSGVTDNRAKAAAEIVGQVVEFQQYICLDRPLIVSECSVNRAAPAHYKAEVYIEVEQALKNVPGIEAIVYFISHWEPPEAQAAHQESWLKHGIGDAYTGKQ